MATRQSAKDRKATGDEAAATTTPQVTEPSRPKKPWSVTETAAAIHITNPKAVARLEREVAAKQAGRSFGPPQPPTAVYKAPARVEGLPKLTPQATTVLEKRYMKKDMHGKLIEHPDMMFRRVAENLAEAEVLYNPAANKAAWAEEFYQVMATLDFLPNSPALANAGRELQQLSACFVLPVEDSLDKIFESVKNTALIHKTGGGTGLQLRTAAPCR